MPTTVTKLIGTGGDYTTLQSWEDACPANLVTVDQIWQGAIKASTDSFSSATNLLTISGTTVNSTHYVELTTNTGASFRDNASVQSNALKFNASNGCAITLTGSYTQAIVYSQDFCRFSNLQINSTGTLGAGNHCIKDNLASGSATIDINNCILETATANAVLIYGSSARIRNSLCVVRASSKASIAAIQNGAKAVNCTFVVPSDKTAATNFFDVTNYGGSTGNFKNCAFFNATNLKTGSATPTYTTCYTDMASPPTGATTATYNTTQFVNITDATRDYRIPTGSAMKDTGTTDSTYAATDIAGTARPSGSAYDVGCWEFVAAAANVYNPLSGRGGTVAAIFSNR